MNESKPKPARPIWKRILWRLVLVLLWLPLAAWGVLVFVYGSWPAIIARPLALIYGIGCVVAFCLPSTRRVLGYQVVLFGLALASFFSMRPSNSRQWQSDVTATPYADITENRVTLHNVRNCDYTSETNYTVRYETRTYDLSKLKSADVLFTDWGLKIIAHTMISFGFEGGDYLCVSIETRKEVGEDYSALKGFFRQYELIYIAADERDVVRLRTNYRQGEEVYLYRLRVANRSQIRGAFLDYVNRMNQLRNRAEWYHAVMDNCMTSAFRIIRKHAKNGRAELHWSVMLNGYAPEHAYSTGALDTSRSFEALKRGGHINERARRAGNSADFSEKIREAIPGMEWKPRGD